MREQCRAAILEYADEETQRNAALTGEHAVYVQLVLQLMRDQYHQQQADGAVAFVVPDDIATILTEARPWEA